MKDERCCGSQSRAPSQDESWSRPANNPSRAAKKIVRALLAWFAANARDLPWRRTRDPYAIWISEIMLQQTQVATVIPYWNRWMRELPTIQSVAKAKPAKLRKLWEGLGYYTRVRNLQKAARQITEQHDGKFPQNYDAILALPGVGRYTAGAIASIAFNQSKPILDGNVIRVLARLFAIRSNPREAKTNDRLWHLAEKLVGAAARQSAAIIESSGGECGVLPKHRYDETSTPLAVGPCSALNQSLMELGAVICTPRNPRCEDCPVARLCAARRLGIAAQLPNTGKRVGTEARQLAVFLVERGGRILARQRPAGVVNAHFWELPQVELRGARPSLARITRQALGIRLLADAPRVVVPHTITRYRIRAKVFAGELVRSSERLRWLSRAELRNNAFTGLDRKILRRLNLA